MALLHYCLISTSSCSFWFLYTVICMVWRIESSAQKLHTLFAVKNAFKMLCKSFRNMNAKTVFEFYPVAFDARNWWYLLCIVNVFGRCFRLTSRKIANSQCNQVQQNVLGMVNKKYTHKQPESNVCSERIREKERLLNNIMKMLQTRFGEQYISKARKQNKNTNKTTPKNLQAQKNIGSCQVSINRFILLANSKHTHKCTLVSIGWWPVYCTVFLCLVSNLTNLPCRFRLQHFNYLALMILNISLIYAISRQGNVDKINTSIANSGLAALVHYLSVCVFPSHFFSPVNSSFVTLFVQIRSIYRLKRHLLLLFSIPFSPYLLLYFLFFFRILVRHFILSICAQFCIVSALDIVYTCHRSMFCFSSFYFCRAFSRMLDFLIFHSKRSKWKKVKQQQQKLIAKIFNYSIFGGSESAWKFIFVVQLFAWV